MLANITRYSTDMDVYVFRPCIVAGPTVLSSSNKSLRGESAEAPATGT